MIVDILLSILLPILVAGINECTIHSDIRNKIWNILVTVISSNMLMGISYLFLKESLTAYEFLFINAAVAVVVELLLIPIIRKTINKESVLKTLCVASVFVAAYSILTYGQAYIHSDTATATILCDSIIRHRSFFPETWCYANGDIWLLANHIFVFLPTILINNQSMARMIGSLIFLVITLLGVVYQSKKTFKDNSWLISIPLLIIHLGGAIDILLIQAAYTGHILWIALCSTLLYEIYKNFGKRQGNKYLFLYVILMILLLIGGTRLLAEQTAPALCGFIVFTYFSIRERQKIEWKAIMKIIVYMASAILIPSGIGMGIYKWLCSWHNVGNSINNSTVFTSFESLQDNIWTTFLDFFECFGFSEGVKLVSIAGIRNMISVILCIIICFIVPYLQGKRINEEKESVQLFYAYGMMHNLIMIVCAIFLGKTASRYLLSTVIVFVIISARYIYEYWIKQKNFRQYMWTGLFVIATIIGCIDLSMNSKGWVDIITVKKAVCQEIISHGLDKGYATYWNAYNNEVYSDLQIRFGSVMIKENSVVAHERLVDSDVFVPEDKNTFLLLTFEENDIISDNLSDICGTPIENFMINGMYVYVFDHDIAEDMGN